VILSIPETDQGKGNAYDQSDDITWNIQGYPEISYIIAYILRVSYCYCFVRYLGYFLLISLDFLWDWRNKFTDNASLEFSNLG